MPKKDRYTQFKFAKDWPSVSQITGIPDKSYLNGWYYKNCRHEKPTAYQIVKESQQIGNLIDTVIQRYCEDGDIKDLDTSWLKKGTRGYQHYFQALQNFHEFVDHFKPRMVDGQKVVYSRKHKYIGTFDRLFVINGKLILGDWKATNNINRGYLLQLEAYYRALIECKDEIKLNLDCEWADERLWLCQFPKKEGIKFDKHIIPFEPSEERFVNGFLALRNYWEQDKKDKEILK